jgi:ankyrin repeat protein
MDLRQNAIDFLVGVGIGAAPVYEDAWLHQGNRALEQNVDVFKALGLACVRAGAKREILSLGDPDLRIAPPVVPSDFPLCHSLTTASTSGARGTFYQSQRPYNILPEYAYPFTPKLDDIPRLVPTEPNVPYPTTLVECVLMNHIEALNRLLKWGVKPDDDAEVTSKPIILKYKWRPLHYAVHVGHTECARMLLKAGADPNAPALVQVDSLPVYWAPLHFAVHAGHVAEVELLLKFKAHRNVAVRRVDAIDTMTFNWTPLHIAAIIGHADIAKVLTHAGAELNAKLWDGATPLHFASANGFADIAEMFTTGRANPDGSHSRADVEAVCWGGRGQWSSALGDGGNSAHEERPLDLAQEEQFGTALHMACARGHHAVVAVLLKAGAKLDSVADDGRNLAPIHVAAVRGHAYIVQQLLSAKANINQKSALDGRTTALYLASQYGHTDVVRLLVSARDQNSGKLLVDLRAKKGVATSESSPALTARQVAATPQIIALLNAAIRASRPRGHTRGRAGASARCQWALVTLAAAGPGARAAHSTGSFGVRCCHPTGIGASRPRPPETSRGGGALKAARGRVTLPPSVPVRPVPTSESL